MPPKIDYKKQLKQLYAPSVKAPAIVEVPPLHFLMIDGEGDPNTSEDFQEKVGALYSASYTLKFAVKAKQDFTVMPLEGLWWADDMGAFLSGDKDRWKWTLMIMQPDFVSEEEVRDAIQAANNKKPLPHLSELRFERFEEGLSAQIMHIGPYDAERPTIMRLHEFILSGGHALRGLHHEIYMSDPRRTAPDRLKTIIRQPVEKEW